MIISHVIASASGFFTLRIRHVLDGQLEAASEVGSIQLDSSVHGAWPIQVDEGMAAYTGSKESIKRCLHKE